MINFDESLPMMLNRALDAVMPAYRKLFAEFDLTEQQWRVMRVLWSSEKVTSAQLAARTLLPSPSLVGIIDRLERKALVARVRSVEDRRVVFVLATAEGRLLQEQVSPQVAAINAELRSRVSETDWHNMQRTLLQISTPADKSRTNCD